MPGSEVHGESVLARLATEEPGKLAQIAYGLLPRDVFISVEQRAPGNLEPDAFRHGLRASELCELQWSDVEFESGHRLMMSGSVNTTESALWLPFRTSRPRPVVLRTGAYQGVVS
jgi:integrase